MLASVPRLGLAGGQSNFPCTGTGAEHMQPSPCSHYFLRAMQQQQQGRQQQHPSTMSRQTEASSSGKARWHLSPSSKSFLPMHSQVNMSFTASTKPSLVKKSS